jgi:esterase/lipase superfamily enzyme
MRTTSWNLFVAFGGTLVLALVLIASFNGCGDSSSNKDLSGHRDFRRSQPMTEDERRFAESPDHPGYYTVRVWFGTNRDALGATGSLPEIAPKDEASNRDESAKPTDGATTPASHREDNAAKAKVSSDKESKALPQLDRQSQDDAGPKISPWHDDTDDDSAKEEVQHANPPPHKLIRTSTVLTSLAFAIAVVIACLVRNVIATLIAIGLLLLLGGEVVFGDAPARPRPVVTRPVFGDDRGKMSYGECDVSIPKDHKMGHLESPSIYKFEFSPDPNKHVALLTVESFRRQGFFMEIDREMYATDQPSAFVFLHGYNVSFADAARRTAQLAYDLDFKGIPLFFSWPSRGEAVDYAVDETNAKWTVPDLAKFLRDLAERTRVRSIYLIAHSMGNRCMTEALERLAAEDGGIPKTIDQVVMTAPDVDADTFRRWIPKYLREQRRFTLYASSVDKALHWSEMLHHYPRAGDSGDGLVIVPPMDTIDASAVDTSFLGHSYYGDDKTVPSDLYYLIRDRKPPSERFGLKAATKDGKHYWVFKR